jgi:choline dehydrogenase-like flavoprotein
VNRRATGAAGVVAAGVAAGVGVAIARRGSGRKRAIVVGSGASGSTVARLLARSGQWDVLVLEKGRNFHTGLGGDISKVQAFYPDDELAFEVRTPPIAQDPILEPRSFRESPKSGARSVVGDVDNLPTVVGGATAHYDAKARRFREVDFVANSLMGGTRDKPAIAGTTYTDWPMEYRHLEPFYAVMEEVIGIQGPAYRDSSGRIVNPNPAESPRSTPFPMPPGVAMYSNLLLGDAVNRLGYHAVPVPTSVNSRPYRGRNACNDCSFCLDFGCPINAKGGGIWVLHDAMTTGRVELRSECNVTHLETDSNGSNGRHRATGVSYIDADGNRHTETADLVVLANTPFEAVRLSLRSGIGSAPDENDLTKLRPSATEPSGLLGRNLMLHLQTAVYAVFNQELHPWRGRTSTHTMDDFAGSGPGRQHFDASVPRGGIVEIGGNQNPISEATSMTAIAQRQKLKDLLRLSPYRKHLAAFTMQGEDMPQLTNYVDLDPEIVDVYGEPVPRITYKSHKYEVDAADHYAAKLMEIMHAVGGPGSAYPGVRSLLVGRADRGQVPQDKHIMGTHRMALDSDHGPCNPYGRYWAFDNLYHAGGGLFVSAPGYNVTHTIWALAYWVAAGILSGADQKQLYTSADIDASWDGLLASIRNLDGDTMAARALAQHASA